VPLPVSPTAAPQPETPPAPGHPVAAIDEPDAELDPEPRAADVEPPLAIAPPGPAPVPAEPAGPVAPAGPAAIVGQVVGQVVAVAAEQAARYVRPEAAVAVATEFTFPLTLALAVLGFLAIQGRVDRRDPKLRLAPQHTVETHLQFMGEDQL
jgi:hypothetical protein